MKLNNSVLCDYCLPTVNIIPPKMLCCTFTIIFISSVQCLCLLDLSAAFDTIDHNILIIRLSSRFGIHASVLCWFKSYLSSHSFRVKCDNNLSSLHTSSCDVPQSSVHGPLFFIMYTTPLSTPISSLSLDYQHLCRWHSALLLIPPIQLWLKHFVPSKRSSTNLFLNKC